MQFDIKHCKAIIFVFFLRHTVAELKLKFLTVLFRHGDRTPLSVGNEQFPTNPYHDSTFEPFGIGRLTDNGKQRARNLGVNIRKKYDDFLGNTHNSEEIFTQSTNRNRTITSLQLALSGIYPDSKEDSFQITYPDDMDVLLIPHDCPKFLNELHRVENTPEFKTEFSKYTDLREKLSNWTGKQLTETKDLSGIFNYLSGLEAAGFALPEWASQVYPGEQLLNGTIFHFRSFSYTQRLRTLNGGIFLKNITGVMSSIIDNKKSRLKMAMYSSHDYNIVGLLEALGVFKPHVPGYSNAIFIELLSNDDDKYYLKFYYYSGIPQEMQELEIPKCANPCPFNNFIELYKNIFPTEEDMKCSD